MDRTHAEKLHVDGPWTTSYYKHLARAEALYGEGNGDAIGYAMTAADLEMAETEQAESARAEREAAILADHRARMAIEAAQAAPAPAPDPAARAEAGWSKAVAALNANVPDMPKPGQGEAAKTVAAVLDEQDQRKAKTPPGAARTGWAKAAQDSNHERGL